MKKISLFNLIIIVLVYPVISIADTSIPALTKEGDMRFNGMIYIPAGEFIMGNDETEIEKMGWVAAADETPKRMVYLKAFYIDKYEVTNHQYKDYIDLLKKYGVKAFSHYTDEGIPIPDRWSYDTYPKGEDNFPVVDVDWYMSTKYCEAQGKRLLTEEEWEKAARGTDGRIYPWGDEYRPDYSNNLVYWYEKLKEQEQKPKGLWERILGIIGKDKKPETERPLPVGSFNKDISPYGVYDMSGNIREWTSSLFRPYPDGTEMRYVSDSDVYVIRGGGFDTIPSEYGRTTSRFWRKPSDNSSAVAAWHTDMNIGIRCAKDITQ